MPRYGTIYVEIDALQWIGDNILEMKDFVSDGWFKAHPEPKVWDYLQKEWIPVNLNDFIIIGTEGECYPCAESVFNRKYVLLTSSHSSHRSSGLSTEKIK